jgi:hypothetical protein
MQGKKMYVTTNADFALAAVILVLFAAPLLSMMAPQSSPKTAVVYRDNNVVREISLAGDATVSVGSMTFEVKSGKIRVSESDCPNHVCMREGWIMNPGQSIVCLPNHVIVEIPVDHENGKYDILSK